MVFNATFNNISVISWRVLRPHDQIVKTENVVITPPSRKLRSDKTEILLKVVLNTIKQTNKQTFNTLSKILTSCWCFQERYCWCSVHDEGYSRDASCELS
jgi:hypothetical protein